MGLGLLLSSPDTSLKLTKHGKQKLVVVRLSTGQFGLGGKGNEGVANFVNRLENSIGYVEFAYIKQSNMNYVKLINKAGKIVSPSIESFKAAADGVKWDPKKHFYNFLINASGENAWPIAGASFILLAKENTEKINV